MFYIHHISCISPQGTGPVDNQLRAIEPNYEGIPGNVLRRMSKSVRMGVGAALPLLKYSPAGILIGTGYGGMEDSVKFLKQIIDYDEGVLAPGPFVQSTANAIASQIGLFSHNQGYNTTYVHRGLSFESALIDAAMLVKEHRGSSWLVGGVDEISGHHYRFERAEGWYSHGSMAGEGAAIFLVNDAAAGALVLVKGIAAFQEEREEAVKAALALFLERYLPEGGRPDCLISGENGDSRVLKWYRLCEAVLGRDVPVVRFKHLCGEFPTASAFALWLACSRPLNGKDRQTILIYNNYKFSQHSLILLETIL
ncbi:MAG TPA: beta-ketoacyl synthase chain length factor [Puia sp.]|jgi:3-oxoacyl-[acyl-carrier-protein] synthase II|nr:beta-ketoacyl synthase chain length factor [Puia sp.]